MQDGRKKLPLSDEGKGKNDYWKGKVNKNNSNPSLPSGRFFIYKYGQTEAKETEGKANESEP